MVDGEPGDLFPADSDGEIGLVEDFDPAATSVAYEVQLDNGTVVGSGTVDVVDTCTGKASLKVTGDCADPETLTFELSATELEANTEYSVAYVSDGFTFDPNRPGLPALLDEFTTDANGAGKLTPMAVPVAASVAHPAVLANTGSPVTSAALLGGGLVVAGAGAMVATRRRAS